MQSQTMFRPEVKTVSPWPVVVGLLLAALLVFTASIVYERHVADQTLTYEEMKAQAVTLTYSDLQQNTDQHAGKIVFLRGKVVSVLSTQDNITQILVNVGDIFVPDTVGQAFAGVYDNVLVNYFSPNVKEGDAIYGYMRVEGRDTYLSPIGLEFTLPEVTFLIPD